MRDKKNPVELLKVSIANSNPCLVRLVADTGDVIECGEFVEATIVNRGTETVEVRGQVDIDSSDVSVGIVHLSFSPMTLLPGEQADIQTEPYNQTARDGKFLGIELQSRSQRGDAVVSEKKPYSAPTIEKFEFTLQPPFFMAGGDAIRTAIERAPTCHTECTWNSVTSFILGIILPHYDNDEKLRNAATVLIPKIIELQVIATADNPVEFAKANPMTVFAARARKADANHN